jgi:hypothetical protein
VEVVVAFEVVEVAVEAEVSGAAAEAVDRVLETKARPKKLSS